ncbi:hypothetical protein J4437_07645 [Candidatus Woesearchaeota archaeon]|nr:hypothetical protein [Candidatus Woesearchaeota archaeon]
MVESTSFTVQYAQMAVPIDKSRLAIMAEGVLRAFYSGLLSLEQQSLNHGSIYAGTSDIITPPYIAEELLKDLKEAPNFSFFEENPVLVKAYFIVLGEPVNTFQCETLDKLMHGIYMLPVPARQLPTLEEVLNI